MRDSDAEKEALMKLFRRRETVKSGESKPKITADVSFLPFDPEQKFIVPRNISFNLDLERLTRLGFKIEEIQGDYLITPG